MDKDPIRILTPQLSYALPNGTTVKVSSEFVEHVEATEPFSAVHKIKVARRSDGSLLVLSVGTDDVCVSILLSHYAVLIERVRNYTSFSTTKFMIFHRRVRWSSLLTLSRQRLVKVSASSLLPNHLVPNRALQRTCTWLRLTRKA